MALSIVWFLQTSVVRFVIIPFFCPETSLFSLWFSVFNYISENLLRICIFRLQFYDSCRLLCLRFSPILGVFLSSLFSLKFSVFKRKPFKTSKSSVLFMTSSGLSRSSLSSILRLHSSVYDFQSSIKKSSKDASTVLNFKTPVVYSDYNHFFMSNLHSSIQNFRP